MGIWGWDSTSLGMRKRIAKAGWFSAMVIRMSIRIGSFSRRVTGGFSGLAIEAAWRVASIIKDTLGAESW